MRPRLHATVLACAVAGLIALTIAPHDAAPAGPLITLEPSAQPPDGAAAAQGEPGVLRSRRVSIDFSRLPDPQRRRTLALDRTVHLDLFPDVGVTAHFERFDDNPDGVTWVGRVEGAMSSTLTLVYGGGLLAASVVLPEGAFQIRPAATASQGARAFGPSIHVVSQIDQASLPREAPPIEVTSDNPAIADAPARPLADSADFIDLMVVYTPAAAAHAGGAAGIVNLINLGVSETNTSYANSGVEQRLRLVHVTAVDHTESSSFGASLTALRTGSGAFAGIPALRDEHRADLVTLLIHPTGPDACGVAFLLTSLTTTFEPFAYSVTDTSCVSPNYTFAHELGHNMGARHDWFIDSGVTPFSYAHGYVNPTAGQRWRTIMAYVDLCSELGVNCPRVLFWANPDNRFSPFCTGRGFNCSSPYWFLPGAAMGVPEGTSTSCRAGNVTSFTCDADDRRTLNNTALTVANFRQR